MSDTQPSETTHALLNSAVDISGTEEMFSLVLSERTVFCPVFRAEYTDTVTDKAPGAVVSAGKAGLEMACGGGKTVMVTELQAPGKRRMAASAWLLGHPVELG